ncbi:MAG: four helix bundle protein [Paludibacter sp.]|nr:four helix bundle protein [Paludibacter sp.]
MKENNLVQDKSYRFAIKIINLYKTIVETKKEYVLSKQVLRSGTSIGANIEEGIGGQSERDFFAKLNIAYKEARETKYWLRLLRDTGYLTQDEAITYLSDCEELLRIIGSIINTMKIKLNIKPPISNS